MNTKNYLRFSLFALSVFTVLLGACKKDKVETEYEKQIVDTKGIYVLCEGNMGGGNSAISYYDIEKKTTVKDYYQQVNGTKLGETANDLKVYGSKMYCVVSGVQGEAKSFIDIMDAATAKTIKRIPLNTTNNGLMPRFITFHGNKAYVSRYDGVISRIDTTTLNIDGELQLKNGDDKAGGLEGLAVANGKLYVTNSAHSGYPKGLKDKVTVINLSTFTKTKDITVTYNPIRIAAAANGDLVVVSWGNYGNILPSIQRINSVTDEVTGTYDPNVGAIHIFNNQALLATDWGTSLLSFDVASGKIGASPITDGTTFNNAYAITTNSFDQSFVVSDGDYAGSADKAYVFGKDGKLKYSFNPGPLAQTAAFNYRYAYVAK